MCVNGDRKGLRPWSWDVVEVNKRLEKLKTLWYGPQLLA